MTTDRAINDEVSERKDHAIFKNMTPKKIHGNKKLTESIDTMLAASLAESPNR